MTDYLTTFARKYAANYKGLPKLCWQGIILICINTLTIGICFSCRSTLLLLGTLLHPWLDYYFLVTVWVLF